MRRLFFALSGLVADVLALLAAFAVGYALRWSAPLWFPHAFASLYPPSFYLAFWPYALIWVLVFFYEGLYLRWSWPHHERLGVLRGHLWASLLFLALAFSVKDLRVVSRVLLFGMMATGFVSFPLFRTLRRRWMDRLVPPRLLVRVDGALPERLKRQLERQFAPARLVIQHLNDPLPEGPLDGALVVALETPLEERIRQARALEGTLASVWVLTHSRDFPFLNLRAFLWEGLAVLEVEDRLLVPWNLLIKRVLDLVLVLLTLPLWLPLVGGLALLLRLVQGPPVLFRQIRVGRNGRFFEMWKFRTMVRDSDRVLADYLAQHPEEKRLWESRHRLRHDPRVTPLGRWLRRFSLDELPQLVHVLRGQMSLVGPRPYLPEEVERYRVDPVIFRVHPGITGPFQVLGRKQLTFEERIELERFYVRNWSPWMDFQILIRTVMEVMRGEGAA